MRVAATVLAVVAVAWFAPGDGGDAIFDWLTARAIVDGLDPHQSLQTIGDAYGVSIWSDAPAPRLPGALLLTMPYASIPVGWVPFVGKALALACLVLAWRVVRPPWFVAILLSPFAVMTVWYANLSAAVTLLVAFVVFRRSGVALGVATVLRGWPWVLGVVLVLSGKWRQAVSGGLVFVGLNLAGLLLPGVTVDGTIAAVVTAGEFWGGSANNKALPLWLGVPVAAVGLWLARTRLPVGVLAALAVSPVVWPHYLTVLAVPLAIRKGPPAHGGGPLPNGTSSNSQIQSSRVGRRSLTGEPTRTNRSHTE